LDNKALNRSVLSCRVGQSKSLLFVIAVIAVVFCAYRINNQASLIETQGERLVGLETQRKVQFRTLQLLSNIGTIETQTEEDVEVAKWIVKHMTYLRRDELRDKGLSDRQIEQRLMFKSNVKIVPLGDESKLEVLSLTYTTNSSPGESGIALALFGRNKLIDCVTRNEITRHEWDYKTAVYDFDEDGSRDIVVEVRPGIWNARKQNYNIAYKVTENGLELLSAG